jgi:hypothetical protein
MTASAWAVRNIGKPTQEDDGKLDQRQRQALLIRRSGPSSRFIAVHCPFDGEPGIKQVTRLPLEPNGILLKIERKGGGVDYLLFGADAAPRIGSDGGLRFEFDGQVALVTSETSEARTRTLKMIGGALLTCGTSLW